MGPDIATDIVMLAGENPTSWIVYNRLVQEFGPFLLLLEPPVSRRSLIRNRIRKLGLWKTLSQVGFVFLARPFLAREARRRSREICQSMGLEAAQPAGRHIQRVSSVNDPQCRALLQQANPKVVVVNGTRIIKRETLTSIGATFLNVHQGITPQYRGAQGAYWALYSGDRGNCGVTIHVVDEGIDTGGIVDQARIDPQPDDNYMTYPLLQTAAALDRLVAAVRQCLAGRVATRAIEGPSAVWYHPGLLQYLAGRLRGIR
jgi:folate-dependent phosphoribosylglycinamide formyltransferase PurN